jgi:hypothetical protein
MMEWLTVLELGKALVELSKQLASDEGLTPEDYDRRVSEAELFRGARVVKIEDMLKGMLR